MRRWGGGGWGCGVGSPELACEHWSPITFGDLTSYLTYVVLPLKASRAMAIEFRSLKNVRVTPTETLKECFKICILQTHLTRVVQGT